MPELFLKKAKIKEMKAIQYNLILLKREIKK